jgi:hypothetical protein
MELMRKGTELLEKIFEIFTGAVIEITVFWHKKACIGVNIYQHGRESAIRVFTLKAEKVDASETSVNARQITRRHIA